MKIGVVGLPNVGKSTLFNAITEAGAESANYPFCTIEPNVGVVDVPDERLQNLAKLYNSQKITPASVEFVDIAGLVAGASHGEGLGNKFLSHIREVDAIVHVVRCFDDPNIIHVSGSVDPVRDIEIIKLELELSDLEQVTKLFDKNAKLVKTGDKTLVEQVEVLSKLKQCLEEEKDPKLLQFSAEQKVYLKNLNLLSLKPVIYVANVDDGSLKGNDYSAKVQQYAKDSGSGCIVLCARLEEEIIGLEKDERELYKTELGIDESGLSKLIKAGFDLLGLMTFLTAGEKEVRAWTIEKNTRAPQAAGKIHTDFEKGFIRAEIVSYEDLMQCKSFLKAKELGKVRTEGKDYVMQDGDVVLFRFNV